MSKVLPFELRRVVDLTASVSGAYCARLLSDLGAEVWRVEPPGGHPLRARKRGAPDDGGRPGALFRHLAAGQRSVVVHGEARHQLEQLLPAADAVLWSSDGGASAWIEPNEIRDIAPTAVVCAVSPYGLTGPWANQPATELTLQAACGGIAARGHVDHAPVQIGGEVGEWVTGMFAAVSVATSWFGERGDERGELIDVSKLEALALTTTIMYPVTFESVMGRPYRERRTINIPDVHRAKDGYVGFMCATGQQLLDFFAMIERPDLMDDPTLFSFAARDARRAELVGWIDEWISARTVEEVLELAALLRVPAAPIGAGDTIPRYDHLAGQGFVCEHPDGEFVEPASTLWCSAYDLPAPMLAPELGESSVDELRSAASAAAPVSPLETASPGGRLPFEGLRVLEFTGFWAGPIVGNYLAMLGADVVKVESPKRLDGLRYQSKLTFDDPLWWEYSGLYQAPNTGKRGVTIDLGDPQGRDVAERLIAACDVVVENFSPHVFDNWGFTYERLRQLRPDLVLVRMPAYGLEGPWRNRSGYAQTMEMISGMAWITGHPDTPPTVPNGICDPIAGMHALFSLLGALEHRARTGEGSLVISPMVGGALRMCAEQIVEASAYGNVLVREGNRSPDAAPQGLYLSADVDGADRRDTWVAISVATNEQWQALRKVLGDPGWAMDAALDDALGRHAAHDDLDRHLGRWCERRSAAAIVDTLLGAGVPAAVARLPHEAAEVDQLRARSFFTTCRHPELGEITVSAFPMRSSRVGTRPQRAAPLLGEHNREVLRELGGYLDDEVDDLERRGLVGGLPSHGGTFST